MSRNILVVSAFSLALKCFFNNFFFLTVGMQEDGTAMLFSFLSLISIFKVDIAIVDVVIRIKSVKPFQVMKNTVLFL